MKSAQELLDKGNAGAAYEMLLPHAQKEAGNPDFDLLLGIAALDAGKPSEGVFALERVLAVKPDHARARAEIARGYLMLGELETSRKEFETVKAANPPKEVQATIDKFMGALDRAAAGQGTTISGFVEGFVGHDTNVNGASTKSEIAIPAFGGLVFSQNAAGVAQQDTVFGMAAGLNLRHAYAPDLVFTAGINGNFRKNMTFDTVDTDGLDGNLGVTFGADEHRWSASVQGGTYLVDSRRYRDTIGVSGQWMYVPDANSQYSGFVQYSILSYPAASFRDADRTVVGAAYARALGGEQAPVVFSSLYFGNEKPRSDGQQNLGYALYGLRIGGQFNYDPDTVIFGSFSYENRQYKGADPLFLDVRKDDQLDLRVGANFSLGGGWTASPQLSYTDSRSNIVIYKNDRVQALATLRYEF